LRMPTGRLISFFPEQKGFPLKNFSNQFVLLVLQKF